MGENGNDTLQSILMENKILKGKLRGFATLDRMFKDVKEKNKQLEKEISHVKEETVSEINTQSLTEDNDISLETVMKENTIEVNNYRLPSPKASFLENMSISAELKAIFDQKPTDSQDATKLGEELRRLSDSILEIEEKRQRDQEILKVLTKELKKCRSERELLKRENEHFQNQFEELQIKGAEKENWVLLDHDRLENNSDEWKNMYFNAKKKFGQDVTDLRKHLEIKNRENNQLQMEKKHLTTQTAELLKKQSSKVEPHGKFQVEDMISQQIQIFQEDFKLEHEERMKAQAAKLELQKKFDILHKEFQENTTLNATNDKRLQYFIEKCEILSREKVLIKNELELAQQNLKRASEFITNIAAPQQRSQEVERHQQRLDRISASMMTNNKEEISLAEISLWVCPSCTFQNKAWAYNCSICKIRKPDSLQFPSNVEFDGVVDCPPTFDSLDFTEN